MGKEIRDAHLQAFIFIQMHDSNWSSRISKNYKEKK